MLTEYDDAVTELMEAAEDYQRVYANEGKSTGWCERVEVATLRVSRAIEHIRYLRRWKDDP